MVIGILPCWGVYLLGEALAPGRGRVAAGGRLRPSGGHAEADAVGRAGGVGSPAVNEGADLPC